MCRATSGPRHDQLCCSVDRARFSAPLDPSSRLCLHPGSIPLCDPSSICPPTCCTNLPRSLGIPSSMKLEDSGPGSESWGRAVRDKRGMPWFVLASSLKRPPPPNFCQNLLIWQPGRCSWISAPARPCSQGHALPARYCIAGSVNLSYGCWFKSLMSKAHICFGTVSSSCSCLWVAVPAMKYQ